MGFTIFIKNLLIKAYVMQAYFRTNLSSANYITYVFENKHDIKLMKYMLRIVFLNEEMHIVFHK